MHVADWRVWCELSGSGVLSPCNGGGRWLGGVPWRSQCILLWARVSGSILGTRTRRRGGSADTRTWMCIYGGSGGQGLHDDGDRFG